MFPDVSLNSAELSIIKALFDIFVVLLFRYCSPCKLTESCLRNAMLITINENITVDNIHKSFRAVFNKSAIVVHLFSLQSDAVEIINIELLPYS